METITISRQLAEQIMQVCMKLSDEAHYQLNDSPYEHDAQGLREWESDLDLAESVYHNLHQIMSRQPSGVLLYVHTTDIEERWDIPGIINLGEIIQAMRWNDDIWEAYWNTLDHAISVVYPEAVEREEETNE